MGQRRHSSVPMPRLNLPRFILSVLGSALIAAPSSSQAQVQAGSAASASRAELEAMAARFEQDAAAPNATKETREARLADAKAIRQRMADGDFSTGDRIVVTMQGDSARTDTLVVRAGRHLVFRSIPEVSLEGVLRSELKARLTEHVGKYVRNPQLVVTPLVRLSVLGEVARPGYYPISGDLLLSDAIMAAGGPNQTADLAKTVVRRGGRELLTDRAVRTAVQAGRTIDQLDLREGDEIVVGKHPQRNWNLVIGLTTAGVALLSTLTALSRH